MNQRPILKNKLYLYLTEFFSGVAVMAVELGASYFLTKPVEQNALLRHGAALRHQLGALV